MGKVSVDDKMRIQTLREQGLKYRAIVAKYPEKNWKLDTVKLICKRIYVKPTPKRKPSILQKLQNNWVKFLLFTSHSTQNRSFQRRSSQPISWLGTEEESYKRPNQCLSIWTHKLNVHLLTLSTTKSMASDISASWLPRSKLPITILFKTRDGSNQ